MKKILVVAVALVSLCGLAFAGGASEDDAFRAVVDMLISDTADGV